MIDKFAKKQDIEIFLEGKGDFVQINYLENFLKLMPPIEMRKFAYLKLAEIYLDKKLYSKSAEMFKNAALNSVTLREKRENYIREAKTQIMAGNLDASDKSLKRALDEGNSKEKQEIYSDFILFCMSEAKKLVETLKYNQATKLYEKLFRMKISDEEKQKVKDSLLNLYDRLGKIKEYDFLKNRE